MTNRAIAVVGGTGKLGAALSRRLAKAGHRVFIGSRSPDRARAIAEEFGMDAAGMTNTEAASAGEVVIVTVPFAAQEATLAEIAPHVSGKIVVDTTVPLVPPKVMRVQLPPEGSAAARAKRLLGEGISVVSAFHNVAAHKLATDEDVECDRIARDSWRRPGQFRGRGSNDVRSHFHQQDLYS